MILTKRLYQQDSYLRGFTARIVKVQPAQKGCSIVLDQTAFYPESGGQPCDTGTISGKIVVDVFEIGDEIHHIVEDCSGLSIGDEVEGIIDWDRRFTNMQQHTGQHILSQAFLRALDAKTVSSHLGLEHCTIDLDLSGLDWGAAWRVESLANSIVYENRPVRIYNAEIGKVEGLRVKKEIDRDVLRIVEVEGFDKSPCGGTHCKTSGEVGLIKILRWETVRKNIRVEFICGKIALSDYFWKSKFIVDLAKRMTTKDSSIPEVIGNLIATNDDLRRRISDLERRLYAYRAKELLSSAEIFDDIKVVTALMEGETASGLNLISSEITQNPKTVALLAGGTPVHFVFSRSKDLSIDMRPLISVACQVMGGKGGGRPEVCQGGGGKREKAEEALDLVKKALIEAIKSLY